MIRIDHLRGLPPYAKLELTGRSLLSKSFIRGYGFFTGVPTYISRQLYILVFFPSSSGATLLQVLTCESDGKLMVG